MKTDNKMKSHAKVENKSHAKVETKIHAKVENKIHAKVETKIHAKVENKIHAKVENKIHAKVENKSHAKVETKIHAKVENIVSSITIDRHIDLEKFAKTVKGIENPTRFPGVIYRIRDPKLAMLIFRTGKIICSGARSRKDIDAAVKKLISKLREGKIRVKAKPIVEIQNIVASASLGFSVNLDTLALECMETEYEPEQFPGLVYRLDEPKTVMLIFRSGKIIITGAKTPKAANLAAERTREMVKEYNAIIK